jgi:hypothetical protein
MRGCEILWDDEGARIAHELMRAATGKPCSDEGRCPYLPKDLCVVPPTRPDFRAAA